MKLATINDFGINDLSPSPTTGANAATFLESLNPAGGGAFDINGKNFVSCSLP